MQRISKTHDAYKKMKNYIKTNLYPNITVTDDLQILSLAVQSNLSIDLLLYSYEQTYQKDTSILLNTLKTKAKEWYEISDSTYQSLAMKENHAGIIAGIELPKYTLNDFNNKSFLFILDSLEIPGNIGTILRTLEATTVDGIILVNSKSKLHNPKLTQASRGCNLLLPILESTYEETLSFLLNQNFTIYLGEPKLGNDYQSYDYQGKIAIVVGNERFGIQKDWYNHSHQKVYIPMETELNSLNVGVAASILAYEAYMKRKNK